MLSVDGDVYVFPAGDASVVAVRVAAARSALAGWTKADPFASGLEAAELLDVDVDELAWPRALVAPGQARDPAGQAGPNPLRLSTRTTAADRSN